MSTQPEPAQKATFVGELRSWLEWAAKRLDGVPPPSSVDRVIEEATAAARAEVARQVRERLGWTQTFDIEAWSKADLLEVRAAVLALLEDAAPRQPEPGLADFDERGLSYTDHYPAAPDTTTGTQQPPEVREPER